METQRFVGYYDAMAGESAIVLAQSERNQSIGERVPNDGCPP